MKKHIFYFLVCFLCAACLGLLPSCKKESPKQEVNDKGTMNITSEPSGASISILGKPVGTTPRTTNPVPAAMYIVKVSLDGYEPAWVPVTVVAGRQTDVHVPLVQENATVLIDSDPSGAHVQMDGKELGDTPVLLHDLPLGSYSASVQMEGYTRRDISWTVPNGRPFKINVPMMNNIGTLALTSTPDMAEIEIDGKPYGSTPLREFLEQGPHKIRLFKTGYKAYEKIITVTRDKTEEVEVSLEELPGSLTLDSVPTGAALRINGVDYGMTPYSRESIEAGDYVISLSKVGFDPLEQTITIHPGEPMDRIFELEPNTGTIVMSVNPPNMNIYLDGRFVCRTEPEGKSHDISKRVTLKNLSAGEHTITVSNKHAKPNVKSVSVTVGKGKTVQLPELNMWLPDTTIVLKNGSTYTGRLTDMYSEKADRFSFRHSAGITTEYSRADVKEIVQLNVVDEE